MQLSVSKQILLITSILLLFILQEVLTNRYISEPYPALKMPSFSGNKINETGYYEITNVEIKIVFERKDSLILTPRKFFYNAPISHHRNLLRKFEAAEKTEERNPYKQFEFLRPIIPGFFISRHRTRYEIQHHPETIQWLRKQIANISPDRRPVKISFLWYRDQYDPKDVSQKKRDLTGTTTILL